MFELEHNYTGSSGNRRKEGTPSAFSKGQDTSVFDYQSFKDGKSEF